MPNILKLAISGSAFAAWLFVLATLWLNGARKDDVFYSAIAGFYAVVLLNRAIKPDFGKLQAPVKWAELSAILPLLGWYVYDMVITGELSGRYPFVFFLSAWTLGAFFDAAHARWQKIRSPLTKIVVGTVFLTVVAIMTFIAVIYMVSKVDWPFVVRNWDVTLLIVFLPLLLIGWGVLTKWQGRKLPH